MCEWEETGVRGSRRDDDAGCCLSAEHDFALLSDLIVRFFLGLRVDAVVGPPAWRGGDLGNWCSMNLERDEGRPAVLG